MPAVGRGRPLFHPGHCQPVHNKPGRISEIRAQQVLGPRRRPTAEEQQECHQSRIDAQATAAPGISFATFAHGGLRLTLRFSQFSMGLVWFSDGRDLSCLVVAVPRAALLVRLFFFVSSHPILENDEQIP